MKNIDEICFIIQARLTSERTPGKMMNSFVSSNLVDIACRKVNESIIPKSNFYFSAYDETIKDVVRSHDLQIYHRSKKSALSEGPMQEVMEYHDKLKYKYLIVISACCPLLSVTVIDAFIESFVNSTNESMFAVFEKKNYFWNEKRDMITAWPEGADALNTKLVEKTYEAAHCLYAGKMDTIKDGVWMSKAPFEKNRPELFIVPELEAFDIDYPWQFKVAEVLFKEFNVT